MKPIKKTRGRIFSSPLKRSSLWKSSIYLKKECKMYQKLKKLSKTNLQCTFLSRFSKVNLSHKSNTAHLWFQCHVRIEWIIKLIRFANIACLCKVLMLVKNLRFKIILIGCFQSTENTIFKTQYAPTTLECSND